MKKKTQVHIANQPFPAFILDICKHTENTAIGILDIESDEFAYIENNGYPDAREFSINWIIEQLQSKSKYGTVYLDHMIDKDGLLIRRLKKEGYQVVRLGGSYNSLIHKIERKWAELRNQPKHHNTETP